MATAESIAAQTSGAAFVPLQTETALTAVHWGIGLSMLLRPLAWLAFAMFTGTGRRPQAASSRAA